MKKKLLFIIFLLLSLLLPKAQEKGVYDSDIVNTEVIENLPVIYSNNINVLDNDGASSTVSFSNSEVLQTDTLEFLLSPNPGSKNVNVTVNYNLSYTYKLQVFDVLGKQIFNAQLTKATTSLDVSGWRAGVYLMKITTEDTTKTKRFLKH